MGIGVFRIRDWGFTKSLKHQSPIKNQKLDILSPIGDFHFKFSIMEEVIITQLITTLIVEHPQLHQVCKLLRSDSTLRSTAKLLKTGLAVSSQQSAVNRPYHVALIKKSRSQLCQIQTVTLYTLYNDCQIVTVRYSLRYIYCPIVTVISECLVTDCPIRGCSQIMSAAKEGGGLFGKC